MGKRGRPKGSKNKYFGIPNNYTFWCWVLDNGHTEDFEKKGSEATKRELKRAKKFYDTYGTIYNYLKGIKKKKFIK